MTPGRLAVAVAALTLGGLAPRPVAAYDFEIDATTIGQGYQLRWYRFSERDRLLNRRRFTQSLRLRVWDILEPAVDPAFPDRPRRAPVDLYFTASLRFDHDFGEWVEGDVRYPISPTQGTTEDALDAFPELGEDALELDVLYAYVGGRDLLHGTLDFRLGRQLGVETLDWYAFDGLAVEWRTPLPLRLEAHGGLMVRGSSFLGSPTHEPDGTSSKDCMAFDEALGLWTFGDECEQREMLMPTFGLAAATRGLPWLDARVAYRRAVSPTQGGLYPDLGDQAPSWGVNEEKLVLSARGNLLRGGIVPWGAARWNFVLGQVDEARAGVRLAWAEHAITPEVGYSFPSFDGDSIFNVFSTEAYTDARLTWDVWPGRGRLRGYARGLWRRFESSDAPDPTTTTLGGGAGARLRLTEGARGRVDLFYEDGYGGLRAGGDLSGRARVSRDLELEGRVTVIRFDEDSLEGLHATTLGAQAGARVILWRGVAFHVAVEENVNRYSASELRLIGLLDLAFRPEF